MSYAVALAIPPNTPSETPESHELKVAPALIDRVSLTFPSGCVGLVGVRFRHPERQIWPINPGEWFVGNDEQIAFTPNLRLEAHATLIYVEGYNTDDTYDHTVYVRIDVEFEGGTLRSILDMLASLGGLAAPQGR